MIYLVGFTLDASGVADMIYKGKFLVKQNTWRSGPVCFTTFGIILWYTILSQFVLILLSLSRLMTVIYPIDTKFKKVDFIIKAVVTFYILSFLLAFGVTLCFKYMYVNFSINLCLPFIDPTNSVSLVKIITWFTMISQTASSMVIMFMYIFLVKKLKKSKKVIRKSKSVADSEIPLIIQLIIITTSNIICWLPMNSIYVAAMFLSTYPIDLIIWTTVAILPLNSIINPFVFIITSLRKYVKLQNKAKRMVEKGFMETES